jgi:hypothetical protein
MIGQRHIRAAMVSGLAVLVLLLASTGAPGISANQEPTALPSGGSGPAASRPCDLLTPFNPANFPAAPHSINLWYPLVPGTQFILQGHANMGGTPLPHQVILTVTDLTKVVHGVRTVVMWDRDFSEGQLVEAELAFHAQDQAGNVWNLGEYPEVYAGGQFVGAPDTWISGLAQGQGGTLLPGNPQLGTPRFLQAYAPNIIGDCGQVSAVGQRFCDLLNRCYDNVLVIDETSPPEPGIQQKYYAPGIGNFQIGAVNDPQAEVLVLVEVRQLGQEECAAARQAALTLEQRAYQISPNLYGHTPPAEHTGQCVTAPTPTPSETPSPTPPGGPTPTPLGAPSQNAYLPVVAKNIPTPTLPPAIFDGCQDDPNPLSAPNFPVRIVRVDKVAEVVILQNVSTVTVSLEDWNMCSINGNQEHDEIFGTLAPGQIRQFPNTGDSPIWNDTERDDGALYNAAGFLVSYWIDQ